MRLRLAIVLVILLALAGCSGISTGDEVPDRTPYGVEDELESRLDDAENVSQESDPERLAPGLTTAGVDNVSTLVESHYEALDAEAGNRTYVVDVRESWLAENGSEVRQVDGRFVVDPPNRWYRSVADAAPPDSEPTISEGWAETNVRLLRYERPDGEVIYQAFGRSPSERPLERTLESILADAGEATVEPETVNATSWYRVTANVSDVDDVGYLTFAVGDDGVIRNVSYASRSDHVSDAAASELRLEFDAPGPASLERPDWYEEALEETDSEPSGNGTNEETTDEALRDDGTPDEDATGEESASVSRPVARLLE